MKKKKFRFLCFILCEKYDIRWRERQSEIYKVKWLIQQNKGLGISKN